MALKKIYEMTKSGNEAFIVTKNSNYIRSVNKEKGLHKGQISSKEMFDLAKDAGFEVKNFYPATVRLKSKFLISRIFFEFVQSVAIFLNSRFYNKIWDFATESYAYVLYKR